MTSGIWWLDNDMKISIIIQHSLTSCDRDLTVLSAWNASTLQRLHNTFLTN